MQQGDGTLGAKCGPTLYTRLKVDFMTAMFRKALIFRTTREVIVSNGWAGLWRGTTASLAR